ncbi:MAG TPA: GTPase ObgE [Pirellulaceae bacterium]
MFVDRVVIEVEAGKGGNGCMSFRREKFVPRGGPDGGDGGNGGSIIIVAAPGVDSLNALAHRKSWKADRGTHGEGSLRHGRNGHDLFLQVPPGTLILEEASGLVVRDLKEIDDQIIIARGGRGGRGNTHFKSSTHRAPREFTKGDDGERKRLVLELKVIADVGIIGKPNAGKSTLLSRLSRARPEIADYPFTTKHPHLGRVQLDADRSFVMADIPGLIEGAHQGIGLGHEFLRHVQRTRVLVHLVEPFPADQTDPVENYQAIRDELIHYDATLGDRPEIVAISKAELPGAAAEQARLAEACRASAAAPPLLISAVTGQGLKELTYAIARQLSDAPASAGPHGAKPSS